MPQNALRRVSKQLLSGQQPLLRSPTCRKGRRQPFGREHRRLFALDHPLDHVGRDKRQPEQSRGSAPAPAGLARHLLDRLLGVGEQHLADVHGFGEQGGYLAGGIVGGLIVSRHDQPHFLAGPLPDSRCGQNEVRAHVMVRSYGLNPQQGEQRWMYDRDRYVLVGNLDIVAAALFAVVVFGGSAAAV